MRPPSTKLEHENHYFDQLAQHFGTFKQVEGVSIGDFHILFS